MDSNWNGELDEFEDRVQYIELKEPSKINAVIKAEEDEKIKAHEESILKIIEDKQPTTLVQSQSPPSEPKPRFIQDDRERVKIKQQPNPHEQKKQLKEKDKKKDNKNRYEGRQADPKDNKQKNKNKQHRQYREKTPENPQKKIRYEEKYPSQQKSNQRVQYEPKPKYVEKIEKKKRTQDEVRKGENIQIQLIGDDSHYENEIYIGRRDVGKYFDKTREKLQDYDFVVLKSFANFVNKAFLVAGLMAKDYPQLKQVNIPSTVQVRVTGKKTQKVQTRGSIRIELSLKPDQLPKQHMGYQQVHKKQAKKQEYRQKPEAPKKYTEKPKNRPQRNPRNRDQRRFQEGRGEGYGNDYDRGFR